MDANKTDQKGYMARLRTHRTKCIQPIRLLPTVVSSWKAIVGLRQPVTIGIHISTEISKTSHPRDLKF